MILLEDTPFAQLTSERLDEINALEEKLGVILIAYDATAGSNQFSHDKQPSDVINPS
nr:uroporphyrinogen-III decarboxylase [Lysinibacillus odysseyi]